MVVESFLKVLYFGGILKKADIMDAKEVAEYLRLHIFTVHKLARQGLLSAFKVGSDWRFRRTALEKWIQDKEKEKQKEAKNKNNNGAKNTNPLKNKGFFI